MKYRLEFELDSLPRMANASGKSRNWRAMHEERKRWKEAVARVAASRRPPTPLRRARLTLTRFSSVCPDYDGLASGFKAVTDGLVLGGVLEDDSMKHIGIPDFRWEKAPRGKGKVRIVVEQIE
jgi:hypothetical protein